MKIKVLVAAHKQFPMPDDSVYLPVLVGAVKTIKQVLPTNAMTKETTSLPGILITLN